MDANDELLAYLRNGGDIEILGNALADAALRREAQASVALDWGERGQTYVCEEAGDVPALTEAEIQRGCIEYLRYHPAIGFVRRFNAGLIITKDNNAVRLGEKDDPDIIAIMRGSARLLAIECKRPGQKARAGQLERLAELEADGAATMVVDSVEALEAAIGELVEGI